MTQMQPKTAQRRAKTRGRRPTAPWHVAPTSSCLPVVHHKVYQTMARPEGPRTPQGCIWGKFGPFLADFGVADAPDHQRAVVGPKLGLRGTPLGEHKAKVWARARRGSKGFLASAPVICLLVACCFLRAVGTCIDCQLALLRRPSQSVLLIL